MEFTPELSAFQGKIISLDTIHGFSKITGRGGNEDKIEAIIKCLQNFMIERNLNKVQSDSLVKDKVRHFAFYLVLNADLDILHEIVELDEVGYVIWTVPTIPTCLLSEMLWKLHMDTFIYELIVFSCPQLSLQLADVIIENFKYFDPRYCLKNLKIVVTACYRFICRLIFFQTKHLEIRQAVNNFHTCVKFFYEPPNRSKLEKLKKDEKYKYIGDKFLAFLLVLLDCFKEYTNNHKLKPPDMVELYEFMYQNILKDTNEEINLDTYSNKDIKESIDNCNVMLMDVTKELIIEISVEVYCAWSEFEDGDKSLQQIIGEHCHMAHNMLKNISSVCEYPVVSMLELISYKPRDCVDVINDLDSATIINNIMNNNEDKRIWIEALLHRDNLCADLSLLEQLAINLSFLNNSESCKLFNICKTYLKDNVDNDDVKDLLINTFSRCGYNSKIILLEQHFEGGIFNNSLLTKHFNATMTETFNKLTVNGTGLNDVLNIFLQSPDLVFSKIFSLASENEQQSEIMIKVMQCLEKFTEYYYENETEPCLISVTKRNMDNNIEIDKVQNLINFLKGLKSSNIVPGVKLLLLVIMPTLHLGLLKRNIVCIHIQCKLLLEVFQLADIMEYRVPMLAMLAQVLDIVRWRLNTFDNLAPGTLELAIQLIESILASYARNIPDKDKAWLKNKLKNIHPLNMYYYRQLWHPPGDTFLEVVSGVHIFKSMDVEHLTARLSQLLASTTLREWHQIWDNLKIFSRKQAYNIFHEALLLISLSERKFGDKVTWTCLMYCYKNFTLITKSHYLIEELDEDGVMDVIPKFILIENFIAEENIELFCNLVLPLFAFIAEKYENSSNVWTSLSDKIKNEHFKVTLNNIFVKN